MLVRHIMAWTGVVACLSGMWLTQPCWGQGEGEAKDGPQEVVIGGGTLSMQVPAGWVAKRPSSNLVEHEYAIPKAEGDDADGRLTIMAAGGSVEQNIDRWVGQFRGEGGGKVEPRVEKKTIAGYEVHLVDLKGTYQDRKGPFAPAVDRAGYRMLGAIVVTKGSGQQFIKFYGPEKTVATAEESFHKFVESLSTRK